MKILKDFIQESLQNQWYPHIPMPSDIFASDWPYLPIEFDANFDEMYAECQLNDNLFVPHRDKDKHLSYSHEGWSALTLHGIAADKTEHWPQYGYKTREEANLHWTDVCSEFPVCTEFIKSLGYNEYDRVRIMRLAPDGYIMPHTDGEGRIFGPLNIAINNPDGCDFYFRKYGRVPFKKGLGNFLDIGNEHIVYNNSDKPRYHFIVHGNLNTELFQRAVRDLLIRFGVISVTSKDKS